jgi:hypothetical protein
MGAIRQTDRPQKLERKGHGGGILDERQTGCDDPRGMARRGEILNPVLRRLWFSARLVARLRGFGRAIRIELLVQLALSSSFLVRRGHEIPFRFGRDDMAMGDHRFVSSFGPEGALESQSVPKSINIISRQSARLI